MPVMLTAFPDPNKVSSWLYVMLMVAAMFVALLEAFGASLHVPDGEEFEDPEETEIEPQESASLLRDVEGKMQNHFQEKEG